MIRIVCVGKIKMEWKNLQEEFLKRIRKFSKTEIVEIKEGREKEIEKVLRREKERGAYLIVLDERGEQLTSEEFASVLEKSNYIVFFIGGKEGVGEGIKRKSDFTLSLSRMTFSHQLARIILLEQIYRAFCILHNHPYAE